MFRRRAEGQALGRSRGGFSTKIHLKTHFDGHPIAFDLTGGEKGDARTSRSCSDYGITAAFPLLVGVTARDAQPEPMVKPQAVVRGVRLAERPA
jgi:hypothetical protein